MYNFIFLKMGKKNRVAVICGWLMFVVLSPGYALGQQQDLISLKVSDVPFVKVLEEIRKQSGYNFMYNGYELYIQGKKELLSITAN